MKNKAIEMVSDFMGHCYGENNEMELYHAKCCARICVDHIIKASPSKPFEYTDTMGFWYEVKQEIDKLTYDDINNENTK